MNKLLYAIALFSMSSCTYSVTMAHTEGQATDIIDDVSSNTPSTSITPTLTIPAGAL